MTRVKLSRVDGAEEGESFLVEVDRDLVLGRGPLLKIDQASVSRRLASLTWRDGELELVSLHKTPIRICSHGEWKVIAKDTAVASARLEEGDTLELTKNFSYLVTSIVDEAESFVVRDPIEKNVVHIENSESEDLKVDVIKPSPTGVRVVKKKKRELPDWMKGNEASPKKAKSETYLPSALNQKYLDNVKLINSRLGADETVKDQSGYNNCPRTASESAFDISDEDEESSSRLCELMQVDKSDPVKQPEKAKVKSSLKRSPYDYSSEEEVQLAAGSSCLKFSEFSDYISLLGNPSVGPKGESAADREIDGRRESVEKATVSPIKQQKDDSTFPVLVTPKDIGGARSINPKEAPTAKRPSCPFGASCYRKNPVHRQDHAHPGDQDFLQDSDENEDKPECEYGVDCYRKNPQHRKDFKHTVRPLPTRKAKEATKKKPKDVDEYESDFIDDEEDGWEPVDDSDDDADWAPQQGVDEEEDEEESQEIKESKKKKVFDGESDVESIAADIDEYSSP